MSMPLQKTPAGIGYLEKPGTGAVFVFLHGIGSNARSFAPLLEVFGEESNSGMMADARLLAWNAPGYMDSPCLAEAWPDAGDYATALAGFLDDCGVARAIPVGHSLGCLMAAAFAAQYPNRVSHLVLASAACGYGHPKETPMPDNLAARMEALVRLGPGAFAADRAPRLVYEAERNPAILAHVQAAMAEVNIPGYRQAHRMLVSGDLPALLAGVATRPGFIIGKEDVVTPPKQTYNAAGAWADAHPDAPPPRVAEIADAGHAVYLQKPAGFLVAMAELLAESP